MAYNDRQGSIDLDKPEQWQALAEVIDGMSFDHPFFKALRSIVSRKVGAISNQKRHEEALKRKKRPTNALVS